MLLACAAVWTALLAACTSEATTWSRVQSSGILHVGLDPTFPPFEFTDGTTLQGIDVDLAEAIAADLDLEVAYSSFGYDGLYDALATGQVDVLISALVTDVTRTRDFAYSSGYINSGLVLISRSESLLDDYTKLTNHSVGVELGTTGHVEATKWQRQLPDLQSMIFQSADEALSAMVKGQVDAVVVDNVTARLFVGSQPEADLIVVPVTDEPYAMVVRTEDSRLLTELNRSLSNLGSSGRLDAILNTWLHG